MKKIFLILPFIFILNCSFNKVVKHHGVQFLDKKHDKLIINQTNKNDIINLLGKPSTKSTFDNDVWIYIERKSSVGSIYKLGKQKLLVNNVLVLEINQMGLLADKKFYDKNSMNDIEIATKQTDSVYGKRSFVYDFLSSMRQKINDPLGKRAKKIKEN
tara:strand:- start:647 stop:1120 length:474 start_codon:yes stop_codon:yes gene_type:complete